MMSIERFAMTAALVCGLTTILTAQSSLRLFSPSTYGGDRLEIEEAQLVKNGTVQIRFKTLIESAWHCPGANAKTTKKGVELTFVRAPYDKRPEVDCPATAVENSIARAIVVKANGKPVFVKSGKKLVQVFPPKK